MPFRPKGGEVYTYRPDDPKLLKDWLADGHRFSHERSKTIKGRLQYRKYYYHLLLKTEGTKRQTDNRFRKEVYTFKDPELEGTVIIHYMGDATLSIPTAHETWQVCVGYQVEMTNIADPRRLYETAWNYSKGSTIKHQEEKQTPICCANLQDDGHLTAQGFKAGFKGNELSHYLDQHQIRARGLVTAGTNRIIVQDQAGSLLLYGEGQQELKALECSGSKDGLEINCATEKILIAVNGQKELYAADVNCDLKLIFTQPLLGLKATSVSCGLEHVVLVSDTGQVYSYGSGSRGQLGHGELTVDKVTKPTLVDMFEGIKIISVACGGWHSTAITVDGDMYVWGWNESGQLGLPNGKETNVRKDQSLSKPLPDDSSEERDRKRQRTDLGTGDNSLTRESCNIPITLVQHIEPVQVQTIPFGLDLLDELKVKKVSCGTRHTCVVFESGILMTCGWNNYGQLCHGDTESRDFLETVQYFVYRNKLVIDVKAGCWNTAVKTTDKHKT